MSTTKDPKIDTASSSGGGGGTGGGGTVSIDTSVLAKTTQLPDALGQKAAAQSVSVVLSTDGPFSAAMNNVLTNGAVTVANAKVTVPVGPQATVGVQVSGNGAGFVLQPQASMDAGATWINVSVHAAGVGATSASVPTITANGNFEFNAGGYTHFQLLNTTAATSGTVSANLVATPAQKFVRSSGIGDQADTAAVTDTGSASLISLVKRMLGQLVALLPQVSIAGGGKAVAVSIQSVTAGERNINSLTNGYMVHRPETNGSILTGATSAFAVSGGQAAHLVSLQNVGGAPTAGTITITGMTDLSNNAQTIVIPAGVAAFAPIGFNWARCETNLQVTLSNAADKVLVNWRTI